MIFLIFLAALVVLLLGYLFYGRYLAKKWGVDPARETPSQDCFDGKDYVPTPPVVVMGHHFASIAGAGTIIGTVKAAAFGWLPVLLWIVLGSVVFGAAHDFGALFASLRHKGRSLGRVLREHVGEKAQRVFTVFALLVLVLLVACFTNVIADSFASDGAALVSVGAGQVSPQAGAGTASILFVLVGLLFGLLVFRKNLPMIPMTVLCLVLMAASVWAGLNFGLNLPYWAWIAVIAVYLVAASLAPVWALLQPRDFLSSFLLWGMMLFSLVVLLIPALGGKTAVLPAVNESAFSGGALFSMLSVIVFGSAVSGYNALIASGTTAKQLANEKHARPVSVGSVMLNALLALIVLLAVLPGIPDKWTPLDVFALAVSDASGSQLVYYLMLVTAATFALTTLDTCTRLARYLFAELFNPDNRRLKKLEGAQRFFATPAVGTVILVLLGCCLGLICYDFDRLWGLFGAANLLLAGLAMMIAAIWLRGEGKKTAMLVVPMFVLLAAALGYLVLNAVYTLQSAAGWIDYLSLGCSAVLAVLAVILLIQGLPALFGKKKDEAAED